MTTSGSPKVKRRATITVTHDASANGAVNAGMPARVASHWISAASAAAASATRAARHQRECGECAVEAEQAVGE